LADEFAAAAAPVHQALLPLRSITGAMPELFCRDEAVGKRSRFSPKATSRRGAKVGPAPGRSSKNW
jgi:hypothetical protein